MIYTKLCLLLSIAVASSQQLKPTVRVAHGVLQGVWQESTQGRTYASFMGVPYARPPTGKYRFKEPQYLKPWTGVWDASRFLSDCLQYFPFEAITGSENCLFLNVYSPQLDAGALLPVMVFIPGGAFMYGGSSTYDPSHLMDRDMVVVTLNYRLGPLGFLSTGDDVIPGNAGLKDQAFALRWVKENIRWFGGNPDSVTLTGQSAGGASVHYQYLSPLSKGTFHRGIAFSGSAFAPWTHATKPAQKAKRLAAIVGCPTTSSTEILKCLRYRPAEVIVNAQIAMLEWKVHMFTPFTPTVEVGSEGAFLTQYPYHAAVNGAMHRLPLITSIASEEGLYPAACYQRDTNLLKELESRWEELASNIFEYNDTLAIKDRPSVAAKIKQHYLGGKAVDQDTFAQLVQAQGDRLFGADVGRLAQIHSQQSGQPTYLYRYSYRGLNSSTNVMAQNFENYGSSHGDDLLQIFIYLWNSKQPDEVKVREAMLDLVYSFVATGVPEIANAPKWLPVKPGSANLDYLEIAGPNKMLMKTSADFAQRSFWDSLGFVENQNYRINIRDEL